MKRTDLKNDLLCRGCGYIGAPETFGGDGDYVICPQCLEDHAVAASTVDWCDLCGKFPTEKNSNACVVCLEASERQDDDFYPPDFDSTEEMWNLSFP